MNDYVRWSLTKNETFWYLKIDHFTYSNNYFKIDNNLTFYLLNVVNFLKVNHFLLHDKNEQITDSLVFK